MLDSNKGDVMFVSSYSTYIQTNTSDRAAKQRVGKPSLESQSFSSKLTQATSSPTLINTALPVDYISKSQVLNNKLELDYQKDKLKESKNNSFSTTKEFTSKLSAQSSLVSAQSAYESNSKIFSLYQKPHATLNQTPDIEKTLPKEPKEIQEIKELNMRHKMVNTYIANDSYYKITA